MKSNATLLLNTFLSPQ